MRALISFLSAWLILAGAAFGQGTVQFLWHGNTNYFEASFQVTEAEMQPGARWTSQLFLDSMSVSSLSGIMYHGGGTSSSGTGGVYADGSGWFLTFQLNDYAHGTEVLVSNSVIHEKPFSGADMYFEPGNWTYSVVPEPSVSALVGLAICSLRLRRPRSPARERRLSR